MLLPLFAPVVREVKESEESIRRRWMVALMDSYCLWIQE